MRRRKTIAAVLVFCLSAQLLGACGRTEENEPKKVHIGVTYYNQSDTFLNELLECLKEKVPEFVSSDTETVVTIKDAAGAQKTQNDQVKELVDAGCNVLCVNLVDRADPSEIIDLAKENEIPIIFFNREPVAEDLLQWEKLYYVGADAYESGVMQGELAVDALKDNRDADRNGDGRIQYVVLEGEAGHQDSIIRTESAVDTLKTKGIQLEKLSYQIANWNRAQAQNRMEQMMGQYGSEIELVLANNDDMALGAIDAYEHAGWPAEELPLFFGIDGTDVGIQAVIDGKLSGTVYNDKGKQAEAIAQIAVALVFGEGLNEIAFDRGKYVYVPYEKITVENVWDFCGEEKNISQ